MTIHYYIASQEEDGENIPYRSWMGDCGEDIVWALAAYLGVAHPNLDVYQDWLLQSVCELSKAIEQEPELLQWFLLDIPTLSDDERKEVKEVCAWIVEVIGEDGSGMERSFDQTSFQVFEALTFIPDGKSDHIFVINTLKLEFIRQGVACPDMPQGV